MLDQTMPASPRLCKSVTHMHMRMFTHAHPVPWASCLPTNPALLRSTATTQRQSRNLPATAPPPASSSPTSCTPSWWAPWWRTYCAACACRPRRCRRCARRLRSRCRPAATSRRGAGQSCWRRAWTCTGATCAGGVLLPGAALVPLDKRMRYGTALCRTATAQPCLLSPHIHPHDACVTPPCCTFPPVRRAMPCRPPARPDCAAAVAAGSRCGSSARCWRPARPLPRCPRRTARGQGRRCGRRSRRSAAPTWKGCTRAASCRC